jgi:hypothetical protein
MFREHGLLYPCENAALSEQAAEHPLPADAIMLYDWLVRYSEGTPSCKTPICGVKSYRGLLECFTCAAERKEAICWQVRKDKD